MHFAQAASTRTLAALSEHSKCITLRRLSLSLLHLNSKPD
jgi:hypothetical protein